MNHTAVVLAATVLGTWTTAAKGQLTHASWNASGDGPWTQSERWDRIAPPPPGPLGTFPNGEGFAATVDRGVDAVNVAIDAPIRLASLALGPEATVSGQNTLDVDRFTFHGELSGVSARARQELIGGPTQNVVGVLRDGATLRAAGNAYGFFGGRVGSTVRIDPGERLALYDTAFLSTIDATLSPPYAVIDNAGTLAAVTQSNTIYFRLINQPGASVRAESGSIEFARGVQGQAHYHVAAGHSIIFGDNVFLPDLAVLDFPKGSSFSGDGVVEFRSCDSHIAGDYDFAGTTRIVGSNTRVFFDRPKTTLAALTIENGAPTLSTAGTIRVTGPMSLGSFEFGDRIIFTGGGTTVIDGGGTIRRTALLFADHAIINNTLMIGDGFRLETLSSGTLVNSAGATFEIRGNTRTFPTANQNPVRTSTIRNAGVMRIATGGSFDDRLSYPLQNSGTLVVENAATASFNGPLTGGGAMVIGSAGAQLRFANESGVPRTYELGHLEVASDGTIAFVGSAVAPVAPITLTGDIDIDGAVHLQEGTFTGSVNAGTVRAIGVTFEQPVTAGLIHAENLIRFLSPGNTLESVTSGDITTLSVDHDLVVNGRITVPRLGIIASDEVVLNELALGQSLSKSGPGRLIINGPVVQGVISGFNHLGGETIVNSDIGTPSRPTTVDSQSGTVTFNASQTLKAARTRSGSAIVVSPGGDKVVRADGQLDASRQFAVGMFDLNDNALIFDYTTNSPLQTVALEVFRGYAGGQWLRQGLTSAIAAGDDRLAIGFAEAASVLDGGGEFAGQQVDNSTVLARLTLAGDANLDGMVDFDDFARLAAAFTTGHTWSVGDFNYDFVVNVADFARLAANFQQTFVPAAGRAPLPEPSLHVLAVAALLVARRARWRRFN